MNRGFSVGFCLFFALLAFAVQRAFALENVAPSNLKDATDYNAITNAIAKAAASEDKRVKFADGTYYLTHGIDLNKAVELIGNDKDRSKVMLDAQNVSYVYVIYVTHADAFAHGFRFQNSYMGPDGWGGSSYVPGPVTITSGTISNCTVKMSKAGRFNGGVGMTGGLLVDCDITGCSSSDTRDARIGGALRMGGSECVADRIVVTNNVGKKCGAGVYLKTSGARLLNSIIANNDAGTDPGGGVYAAAGTIVSNCVIRGNNGGSGAGYCVSGCVYDSLIVNNTSSGSGGGVYKSGSTSVLQGCTVVDNTVTSKGAGVYQESGSIKDCIIWNNGSSIFLSQDSSLSLGGGTCTYTCAAMAGNGEGNITDKLPAFVDYPKGDYRLAAASPCRGKASDGGDMGYYQYEAPSAARVAFTYTLADGKAPADVTFSATVEGATATGYTWDFGDKTTDTTSGATATHKYLTTGRYTVTLAVASDKGVLRYGITNAVNLGASTVYVNTKGGNTFPYDTWENGATSIQNAINCVISSDDAPGKVCISNGTYSITSAITIDTPVEVIGNDAERDKVIITGNDTTGYLLYLRYSKALVHGVRLTGAKGGTADNAYYHGPVTISSGVLSNSTVWITQSGRYHGGVGMTGGKVVDCLIRGGGTGDGGTARVGTALRLWSSGAVADRVIVTNTTSRSGAGVYLKESGARLLNSFVVDNDAGSENGGGIVGESGSIVSNCVIKNCKGGYGGGYSGSGNIYASTFIGNSATGAGGGVGMSGGTITGCVFSACTAGTSGGGIYLSSGTVDHSTVVRCNALSKGSGIYQASGTVKSTIGFENGNVTGYSATDIYSAGGTVSYSRGREFAEAKENGNISEDPLLRDIEKLDLRLYSSSPCRGTGENDSDMGAVPYVYDPEEPSTVVITVKTDRDVYPVTATYACEIMGALDIQKYVWDFGDGESVEVTTNGVAHVYAKAGVYTATLTLKLKNGDEKSVTKENAVSVYSDVAWVDASSADPIAPYATRDHAARTIAEGMTAVYAPEGGHGTVKVVAGKYALTADTTYQMARAVHLVSESGRRDVYIEGKGYYLRFNLKNANALVSGVVVSNVTGYSNIYGVYDVESGTITNCAAVNVAADYYDSGYAGGGSVNGANAKILGSYFENCKSGDVGYGGYHGIGGLYVTGGGLVEDCVVKNCAGSNAGGIEINNGTVRRTTIMGCSTTGAPLNFYGSGLVEGCRIIGNEVTGSGYAAGVYMSSSGEQILRNCLVTGNTSANVSAGIAGVGAGAVIENCTVADNIGKSYAGIVSSSASATWRNVLSWGNRNAAGTANPDKADVGVFEHCLTGVNPRFRGGQREPYRLTAGSPAVNAGVKLDWMTDDATDIIGNPRISALCPDVGCYEHPARGMMLILK